MTEMLKMRLCEKIWNPAPDFAVFNAWKTPAKKMQPVFDQILKEKLQNFYVRVLNNMLPKGNLRSFTTLKIINSV